jgi:hypothetical protein
MLPSRNVPIRNSDVPISLILTAFTMRRSVMEPTIVAMERMNKTAKVPPLTNGDGVDVVTVNTNAIMDNVLPVNDIAIVNTTVRMAPMKPHVLISRRPDSQQKQPNNVKVCQQFPSKKLNGVDSSMNVDNAKKKSDDVGWKNKFANVNDSKQKNVDDWKRIVCHTNSNANQRENVLIEGGCVIPDVIAVMEPTNRTAWTLLSPKLIRIESTLPMISK